MPAQLALTLSEHAAGPILDAEPTPTLAAYVEQTATWDSGLLHWERRFLRGAFGQPGDAALTVARGAGKSALVAAVASAVVDPTGPLHGPRREVVVVASSFEQARTVFSDVLELLATRYADLGGLQSSKARHLWRVQDSANRALIEWRRSGARVRCIGSDPTRAHGLRPALVLADEPAQWPPATSDKMLAALRTGLGKVPDSRLVALGTRPARSEHWFAKMLAGGAGYAQVHAARPTDPPFQRRTWKRACPSLDAMPDLEARIRLEADAARRDRSLLVEFKSLRLNLGTSEVAEAVLIAGETWASIEADGALDGGGYVLGVDLGSGTAMSACAAYWPDTGRLEAVAAFPAEPGLAQRGLADGVGHLYGRMHHRGELVTCGRLVVDVTELLSEALDRWGAPAVIVSDRWRKAELVEALTDAGVPPAALVTRGQGWRDGGEDVRQFRRAALDGRLSPVESLLLRSAMSEARVVADFAGNEKLAKGTEGGRRSRGRDDAAAAAILAVSEGTRRTSARRPSWRYAGLA